MLWHIAEWAGTVLAAGMVAGLLVAALGAVAAWLVYRRVRHRVEAVTGTAARYALQAVAGAGRGRSASPGLPGRGQRTWPPGM
jgi:hypothetical protein